MQKKEVGANFFATNNKGSYLSIGKPFFSQYNGIFFFIESEWNLYKTIDSIERIDGKTLEGNFSFKENTVQYTGPGEQVKLSLDFRRIHDYDDQGRIYKINSKENSIIIRYDKYENNALQKIVETKYLAVTIKSDNNDSNNIQILSNWIKKIYEYDQRREIKSEFYVYEAAIIKSNKFTIGFGQTEKEALTNSMLELEQEEKEPSILKIAENSLKKLIIHISRTRKQEEIGILAGFPWFYQIWGRDENISLGGLIASKQFSQTKKILLRNLDNLNKGFVPNRYPQSELDSIDATGWLYKRIEDFLISAHKTKTLHKHITKKELEIILKKLDESIIAYVKKMEGDLIINKPLETWIDTTDPEGKDGREGARIEIQCLFMNMCVLAQYLSKILGLPAQKYEQLEQKTKSATKKELMHKGILIDGKTQNKDLTTRPNVFLAHQIYPPLLTNKEWEKTFDKVIEECWLDWGGLTSISKNSPLYVKRHTGFNNSSYHRGDSWYFVNNIAAMSMMDVNYEKYSEKIEKIAEASIKEMLYSGIIGQCAELSSAEEQTSEGCLAQAWSSGTIIELIHKLS